jgi:hemerythrin-like domain-containing protein
MRDTPPPRHEGATVQELIATEHAAIREHLDHVRALAEDAQHEVPLRLRSRLDAPLSFLHRDLASHFRIEEEVLYPALDRVGGGSWSSRAMALDHEAITRLRDQLDDLVGNPWQSRWTDELQRLLFVFEAITRLHVEKEELLFTPLLDRLEPGVHEALRQRLAEHATQHGHGAWGFSARPRP